MSVSIKLSNEQKKELMEQVGVNWDELVLNLTDTPDLLKLENSSVVIQGKTWSPS